MGIYKSAVNFLSLLALLIVLYFSPAKKIQTGGSFSVCVCVCVCELDPCGCVKCIEEKHFFSKFFT